MCRGHCVTACIWAAVVKAIGSDLQDRSLIFQLIYFYSWYLFSCVFIFHLVHGKRGILTRVYALSPRKVKEFCLLNQPQSDLIIWVSNVAWISIRAWTWLTYKDMWAVMILLFKKESNPTIWPVSCSQVLCIFCLSICSVQVAAMAPLKLQWLLDRLWVSFDSSLLLWVAKVFGLPCLELWIEQDATNLLQGRSLLFLVPHADSQHWTQQIHYVSLLCQQNKKKYQSGLDYLVQAHISRPFGLQ